MVFELGELLVISWCAGLESWATRSSGMALEALILSVPRLFITGIGISIGAVPAAAYSEHCLILLFTSQLGMENGGELFFRTWGGGGFRFPK